MLNISQNNKLEKVSISRYKAVKLVTKGRKYKNFNKFLKIFLLITFVILFLPWTQNVTGRGFVTTLTPDQRPQTIQSPIPGRIEQWYVREGDFVKKGDTVLHISEVKNEYFDPQLVERTGMQIRAKEMSVVSYKEKVKALDNQIAALEKERGLKLKQARNKLLQSRLKVKSDSIDLEAAKTNITIAQRQFDRTTQLESEGLKAVTDVEAKRVKLQETQAKLISQENKLLASKNEVINAQVEITRVEASFVDKISKAQSNKFTAQSNQFDSEATVTKLQNQFSNYSIRNDLYYIKAPQDGFINRAVQGGIGETFKEGDDLVNIMPANIDIAVETFVSPLDLPLIHVGEK